MHLNKKRRMFKSLIITLFLYLLVVSAYGEDINVSLALLPPVINKDETGILANFIRLLDAEYNGGTFSIEGVYPFKRSVNYVGKKSDLHWPSLEKPDGLKNKSLMYSTETFYKVNFVLYTKKGASVDINNLQRYKIGTQLGQKDYFPFKVEEKTSLENSLKMVDAGRLDGFIFSMFETDSALKTTNLKTIERQLYKKINVKMILPNNPKGKKIDNIITSIMKTLRKNGEYEKLMGFLINAEFKK